MVREKGLLSFFCLWLSSCSNIIYLRDCPIPIACSWHFGWKSMDHQCMDLFPVSPFCSSDLCVYSHTNIMLFWLLYPCSVFWSQVMWPCRIFLLLFCFYFSSRLLWLFRVSCGSIKILRFFFNLCEIHNFDSDFTDTVDCFT